MLNLHAVMFTGCWPVDKPWKVTCGEQAFEGSMQQKVTCHGQAFLGDLWQSLVRSLWAIVAQGGLWTSLGRWPVDCGQAWEGGL